MKNVVKRQTGKNALSLITDCAMTERMISSRQRVRPGLNTSNHSRARSSRRDRLRSNQSFTNNEKRFRTPSRLNYKIPTLTSKYQQRSGSWNRKRSDVRLKYKLKESNADNVNNTLNISDKGISGQGVLKNNLTVLIMTLNDTNQLKDVLSTLTPQTREINNNLQRLNQNLSPANTGLGHYILQSPTQIKDSMTLNTHRIECNAKPQEINGQTLEAKRHNKSIFSNLNSKNFKEKFRINPKKVNIHKIKKQPNLTDTHQQMQQNKQRVKSANVIARRAQRPASGAALQNGKSQSIIYRFKQY